jgi:L-fuculose-phosphate aldolase
MNASMQIIEAGIQLIEEGLSDGTNGNISTRCETGNEFLITPTARNYRRLAVRDLVRVDLVNGRATGHLRPSSESRLHAAIYRSRPDVNAIVHHHATFATAVAVARKTIPVLVDEASDIGPIHTAPYAASASLDLATIVAQQLATGNNAVLVANHGAVAVGSDLNEAIRRALAIERLAKIYIAAEVLGGAHALDDDAIAVNREFFAGYRTGHATSHILKTPSPGRGQISVGDLVRYSFEAAMTFISLLQGFILQRLRRVGA